jgi:hypothetical protein
MNIFIGTFIGDVQNSNGSNLQNKNQFFVVVSVDICLDIGLLRKLNIKLWPTPFNNLQLRGITGNCHVCFLYSTRV